MANKIYVIACAALAIDLKHSAKAMGLDLAYKFLEAGLHSNPTLLKKKLQAAIDAASSSDAYRRIIIGYGICGKGTIGIRAGNVPLVIPKVHDCIALFLGGDQAYKDQFKKYPGTYYLSAGWCKEKTEPISQRQRWTCFGDQKLEFNDLVKKHGEKAARKTFEFLNTWQKNYQRAAYIETQAETSPEYEALAKNMARKYHWQYDKISGSPELIEALLMSDATTEDVLFVPPDHVIEFDPVQSSLSANPIMSDKGVPDNGVEYIEMDADRPETSAYIKVGLGIDAGGTYTDAVVYDLENQTTLCKAKSLTTKWDFTLGIGRALEKLDPNILVKAELIALSTTLATNAIIENDGQKVGLILMPPYGLNVAREIPCQPQSVVQGQLEINGKEIISIDPDEIITIVDHFIDSHHVTAFAVSGYAGSINPSHELQIKKLIEEKTGYFVSCGHELSDSLNFQTRAVTAMLNARIIPRLTSLLLDLERVMEKMNIKAPVVVIKGDGTLMSADMAQKRPVETILSGPAASVAGARHLTGLKDALVVDMGGTTTDTAVLSSGRVNLNESGSKVGGHRTHVKALGIRTTGLGGDSLIQFENGRFSIGPKRVAPIAWLGQFHPETSAALQYLSFNLHHYKTTTRKMQILAKTGDVKDLPLTPLEEKTLALLETRPYSIDEMVEATGVLSDGSLPLQRLEENFIIQKCGLTFTDLLHVSGQFQKWNTDTAFAYCELYALITRKPVSEIIETLMALGVDKLTMELIKRCLDEDVDSDKLYDCPVCRVLFKNLMKGGNPSYDMAINLKKPVIGIGAPIAFFLHPAVKPLIAEAVLPKDADVANAIGAITSHVVIQKQMRIIPGEQGGFIIEGICGNQRFKAFESADRFARQALVERVRKLAKESGTSGRTIKIHTKDKMPRTATGDAVFMGRTLSATLKGPPDMVLKKSGS